MGTWAIAAMAALHCGAHVGQRSVWHYYSNGAMETVGAKSRGGGG